MAQRRSTSSLFIALGLIAPGLLGGCARLEGAPEPGAFEMEVEHGAPFTVVGRFRLRGVDPGTGHHEIPFDTTTTRVTAELPPGKYVLSLEAGAALVCPEDGAALDAPASARVVSTWPQQITITAGGRTRAHINYGLPPTEPPTHAAAPRDPCAPEGDADGGAEATLWRL